MVGCRYGAKNTLPKNYLYFAEENGAEVIPEVKARDIKPLTPTPLPEGEGQEVREDGARYEVTFSSSTAFLAKPERRVRARHFFTGLYETALQTGEILVAAEIPCARDSGRAAFRELARRHGDYAIAGLAVQARVAVTGHHPLTGGSGIFVR